MKIAGAGSFASMDMPEAQYLGGLGLPEDRLNPYLPPSGSPHALMFLPRL